MNYENKINDLLREYLSEKGFEFWTAINKKIINIWDRPSSSSGKYHKKSDGSIPCIGHHTFEMLYAGSKIMRAYNINKKTIEADSLLLAITLHDSMKYGKKGNSTHTVGDHDRLIADSLQKNISILHNFLSEKEADILIESVRFHNGQWSKDVDKGKPFSFNDRSPIAHLVHMLDMLSTADCLKFTE